MKSKYKCPLCGSELELLKGEATNPENGYCVECRNPKCGMADWGHGKNEDEAFKIFNMKCGKA